MADPTPKPDQIRHFIVPLPTMQGIVNYLDTQPHGQVRTLMQAIERVPVQTENDHKREISEREAELLDELDAVREQLADRRQNDARLSALRYEVHKIREAVDVYVPGGRSIRRQLTEALDAKARHLEFDLEQRAVDLERFIKEHIHIFDETIDTYPASLRQLRQLQAKLHNFAAAMKITSRALEPIENTQEEAQNGNPAADNPA